MALSDAGAPAARRLLPELLADLDTEVTAAAWPVTPVTFGAHPDQLGDLRLPKTPATIAPPLALVLHGGFFRHQVTRSTTAAIAVHLARLGWASLNLEYRRGPGQCVEDALDDVTSAVDVMSANSEDVDASRLIIVGHSVGGFLALWSAARTHALAVLALAPVTDLYSAARAGRGAGSIADAIGGPPDQRDKPYNAFDLPAQLPLGVPQLIVHGTSDDVAPLAASRVFTACARERGDDSTLLETSNDHFELLDPQTRAWDAVFPWLDGIRTSSNTPSERPRHS